MQKAATVRAPHAFNLLRQLEILHRSGCNTGEKHFEDIPSLALCFRSVSCCVKEWSKATSVARAFSLGKLESEAVSHLQTKVSKEVVELLKFAVQRRGMTKLVTHDLIAKEIFNENFSSGTGVMTSWQEELRNLPDCRLVA